MDFELPISGMIISFHFVPDIEFHRRDAQNVADYLESENSFKKKSPLKIALFSGVFSSKNIFGFQLVRHILSVPISPESPEIRN